MKNKEVEQQHLKMQNELNKLLLKDGLLKEEYKIVAVGYLDSSEPFEKGKVSTSFLTKLRVLWNEGMTLSSMGHHECPFCEGERATSSSEKILIDEENKIKYIFPWLIFHYIEKHQYLPPKEFIEFVMRS